MRVVIWSVQNHTPIGTFQLWGNFVEFLLQNDFGYVTRCSSVRRTFKLGEDYG